MQLCYVKLPPPRERPDHRSLPKELWNPEDALGRHVFSEPLTSDTTLLQLTEKVEQEFAIPKKYQGHFTIFPYDQDHETGQWPPRNNRPLSWSMTLAEVHQFGLDVLSLGDNAPTAGITKPDDAPVLHLVLETKSAALMRIVGPQFLEEQIGEPNRHHVDYWNSLDSFWHYSSRRRVFYSSLLESNLWVWRGAHYAGAYLARQREKGLFGPYDDELRTSVQRVEEIRERQRQDGLSEKAYWDLRGELGNLLPRIRLMERAKANGCDELQEISVYVTEWEDWITNRDFQNFAIRLLDPDDVEPKVAAVIRQARQVVDGWISSEDRQQFHASMKEEYYAARPWLTDQDRANAEHTRLDQLKCAEWLPEPVIWGAGNTSTDDPTISSPQIQAHSIRRLDGTLLPDPSISTFTISSGSLLWGQMVPLYSTMLHSDFTQNADSIPPELEGGTIRQHRFSYRSAARNGQWKVRPYSEKSRIGRFLPDPDGPEFLAGWILRHEDVDPRTVLQRVRGLDGTGPGAVSNKNRHTDKVGPLLFVPREYPYELDLTPSQDILYVGRYDWSHHSLRDLLPAFQQWAEPAVGPVPDTRDAYGDLIDCSVRKGGYMIAIDEARFGLDFAAAYKRDCDRGMAQDPREANRASTPIEKMFRKDGRNFGTFLSMMYSGEDYGE
ncbi:hypothetical protein NEMBOFW57_009435 [Staphylotrichum longicolle]|uniref:Uncharacterized protein n=1 Tax=Staphylotrichum longicolle TaxID=669026 RepID=A0AAD4HVY7_9PEZI|nr:hypothetical protein NEMBOFW57_009435 [Staphylotrichum longicolle]